MNVGWPWLRHDELIDPDPHFPVNAITSSPSSLITNLSATRLTSPDAIPIAHYCERRSPAQTTTDPKIFPFLRLITTFGTGYRHPLETISFLKTRKYSERSTLFKSSGESGGSGRHFGNSGIVEVRRVIGQFCPWERTWVLPTWRLHQD